MSVPFKPKLKKPKNMPGSMPSPAVKKKFGGKQPGGAGKGKMHTAGSDISKDQHGLHGASSKAPRATLGSAKRSHSVKA